MVRTQDRTVTARTPRTSPAAQASGFCGMKDSIEINGETYVKASARPTGSRAVVVINRGWIYAGDVLESNGRIILRRAVWVFNWREIGFAKVPEDPGSSKADLRPMSHDIDIPGASEVYRIPVSDDWGLPCSA